MPFHDHSLLGKFSSAIWIIFGKISRDTFFGVLLPTLRNPDSYLHIQLRNAIELFTRIIVMAFSVNDIRTPSYYIHSFDDVIRIEK